jgi:hypothetical protein
VDTGVKVPDFAGLGMSQTNRRISIAELRRLKSDAGPIRSSFEILRFSILRFCGSLRGRARKKTIFAPAEEDSFQTGVGKARSR